jgi:GNAT superfamily N-acetyltransferase
MNLRAATLDDTHVLALHHRKMMEEIVERKGSFLEKKSGDDLEAAHLQKIQQQMPQGTCLAWLIEHQGRIAASGAISLISLTPVPSDLNATVAFVHSIYTEPAFRRQGCAEKIMQAAVQYCRQRGIHRLILNASEAGRSIYERFGFTSSPESMRLLIP